MTGLVPVIDSVAGLPMHCIPAGAPVQLTVSVPVNPPMAVTMRLYVAVWPALIVAEVEEPEAALTARLVPAPDNCTVCGLPGASS